MTATTRQLSEEDRQQVIARLENDMADTLAEWAIRDRPELLAYVSEKENYKDNRDEDLITLYAERFDELPPGIPEYTCSHCEQLVHYEKSSDKDVLIDRTGGDVCGVNGDNAPHAINRTDDGYVL